MIPYDAVLFIGFGGPEKREDILPFLNIVTRGRGIPKERLDEVAHHYELLGGSSPINAITRRQAQALEKELASSGAALPVYIGQRNWYPFIEETLRRMAAEGIKRAIGFPAAPHRSEASLERYIHAVETARQKIGPGAPQIDYVNPWFDHPLFIDAIAERVRQANPPESAEWFFTAHSIPCAMAKDSTYVQELQRTAQAVAEKFGKKYWRLAYSSRSGNPREPWLEPDVCDVIRRQAARKITEVFFIPIGFIADHVEILFDLDIEAKEAADQAGVRLTRAKSVGDHPLFVRMMADVIGERARIPEAAEQCSSVSTQYADGRFEKSVGKTALLCFCQPGAENPPCCQWTASSAPHPS